MVDLTPFKEKIKLSKSYEASDTPRSDFMDALYLAGFENLKKLTDNKITRIKGPGDKGRKKSGWYVYTQYEDMAIGIYGSWKSYPEKAVWTSRNENTLSLAEKMRLNEDIKKAELKRKEEEEKLRTEAAEEAYNIWSRAKEATQDNPYIAKKKIKIFDGIRELNDVLIVPVTVDGQLTSIQKIKPDSEKRFLTGGRTKGCYYQLKGNNDTIYIAEGYATAASIAEATGNSVYISFSAHNLYEVAQAVKDIHKESTIIIAADNDETCINKVNQIKDSLGIPYSLPKEGYNDFNDWHVAEGMESLQSFFKKKPKTYKKKESALLSDTFNPGGILAKIEDYYNATSGNHQPLFAKQCAIAACSVILSRNFETNFSNRSSLYLMNIGKSGTGKEHAKKVIENILEATDNANLIAGDGYTSASAVISALQERPRHITIIDEFSKYLQAAANKYGSSHLMEANAQLMQAIGRLNGTLRAKSYASIGLSKEKKQELANQKVINPAITLLSMTTPDDLFNTVDVSSIKDGFLNRFIICISDAERALRVHKEPIEVPQDIIDWDLAIKARKGDHLENPAAEPHIERLSFTIDAIKKQEEFQQYCINMANDLEKFGMDEIPGRSNEMAMRLALIIALSQDPYAERITEKHMGEAISWLKFNLDRLADRLKMAVSNNEYEAHKKEVLQALRNAGAKGVIFSHMHKNAPYSKHRRDYLKEILFALKESDLAYEEAYNAPGPGRATQIWRACE